VLLEEPEHLNWYRAGSRWSNEFRCKEKGVPVALRVLSFDIRAQPDLA
jgi:hypothetical protein